MKTLVVYLSQSQMGYVTMLRFLLQTKSNSGFLNEIMNLGSGALESGQMFGEATLAKAILRLIPESGRKVRFTTKLCDREYNRFWKLSKELGTITKNRTLMALCFLTEKRMKASIIIALRDAINESTIA